MSKPKDFPNDTSIKEKAAIALFGRLANPRAQKIFSSVMLWPDSPKALSDSLGNYANIIRWTTERRGKRKRFTEARIHPAIDALLEIIVPALCKGDPEPFSEYAAAIEARKFCQFPNLPVAFHALNIACELTGHAPPFNAAGEKQPIEIQETFEHGELKPVPDFANGFNLPVIQAEFRRKVEHRIERYRKQQLNPAQQNELDPSRFSDLCNRLKITCAKDPAKGGRKRNA
jgi:hypothetical protein